MTRLTADVVYGITGQTVSLLVRQGNPTSATFKVFKDFAGDDATAEFSGTATVLAVSTTVDAASGPAQTDPQKLSVAATTSMATTRLFLVEEGSKKEWVQPIEIVSADYIRCRHPLKNNYTTAATVKDATITAAIDATWVAAEENLSEHTDPNPSYRVRWAIVVGTTTHIAYSYFDLVRAPITHHVEIDDVNARAPGLYSSLPTEYEVEQGRPLITAAWDSLRAKFGSHALDVDAFRNDEVLDELVILSALRILALGGWKPLLYESHAQYVLDTERGFETFFQANVAVILKSRVASGTSGAADVVQAQSYWSK